MPLARAYWLVFSNWRRTVLLPRLRLIWAALRGRPIVYRARLVKGVVEVPAGAYLDAVTWDSGRIEVR